MPISPVIRQRIQALQTAAIDYAPGTERLAQPSGSDHFELLKARVGDAGLQRMFERGQWVKQKLDPHGDGAHPEAPKPETMLSLRVKQGKLAKPKVRRDVMGNHYDPRTNTVALMDPRLEHYAAHELRHAYDHTHRKMDLHEPTHRLTSEVNAFGSQIKAAEELGVDPGLSGRTAQQQARTYEGKPGYPGTLESSAEAVRDWRER
ncbi:mitochondrial inner membrane protease ATP23 [Myxococcota bacterium]|nr:mitochondrial inner membrane protease ATP23 [Myxococcota bacterium]